MLLIDAVLLIMISDASSDDGLSLKTNTVGEKVIISYILAI